MRALLFQGGDALLGEEEGRTHPRAPNLAVPGVQVGVWDRSTGYDPSAVQWAHCSRHLLNLGEWGMTVLKVKTILCGIPAPHGDRLWHFTKSPVLRGSINADPASCQGVTSVIDVDF